MSDPFPAPEQPAPEHRPSPPATPVTPLAKYADPSLTRSAATPRTAAPRGSVEWVRPAEIARRGSTLLASGGLDLGRRLGAARDSAIHTGLEQARSALRSRGTALTSRQRQQPEPPAPPALPGPGL
jgi:hypothetical protein